MLAQSADPKESQRLQGMCNMHTRFVRSLESLVLLLLKEKCPNENWNLTSEQQEEKEEQLILQRTQKK